MIDFQDLLDLASARLGGSVLYATDDYFAEKENLLRPEKPVWKEHEYTDRGKWMDGWESRRKRTPGHDFAIIRLGLRGVVRGVIVDTAFFRGNYPSHCSIDACGLPSSIEPTAEDVRWHPILERSELMGDSHNTFAVADRRRFTHLRLNIFPDGGVARLRVLGEVLPAWSSVLAGNHEIDLAAAVNGGYVVDTSDRFFAEPRNLLMPYAAANTGDGWETKRRRGPGHDWCVIRLGAGGAVDRVELDTTHFKGNYPDSCSVDVADVHDEGSGVSADVATRGIADWTLIIGPEQLEPDHRHEFRPA
ncbi:MAG TPA: allantoicase, partial [Thermoanaerobaculia bacterium]|nr:allantoicase [Thermoanaerobaculia bacterium]